MKGVRLTAFLVLCGCVFIAPTFAQQQQPNLGGTWRLNEDRSSVAAEVTFVGLVGVGAPGTLHVTQPANGTVVVESQFNESHARFYVPGDETETSVFLGEVGSVKVHTRWEDARLIAEGTRVTGTGPSATQHELRESFLLSDDGETLEVELTFIGSPETSSSLLRYERIDDVEPCESWPSPCKEPPR
jgi:hypothetical protein